MKKRLNKWLNTPLTLKEKRKYYKQLGKLGRKHGITIINVKTPETRGEYIDGIKEVEGCINELEDQRL